MINIFHTGNKVNWKEYYLFFFFILLVGNPFLMQNVESGVIIILLTIFIYFRGAFLLKKTDLQLLLIIIYFVFFELIHRVIFDLDNTKTIVRVGFYFITALLLAKITRENFLEYYVNIVYKLSIISLLFYVLGILIPSLYGYLNVLSAKLFPLRMDSNNYSTPTLLIYTFDPGYVRGFSSMLRNPGYSWEAGGFATYANIAILFRLISNSPKNIIDFFKDKVSFIILLAMLLTFSTAGYISFSLMIIAFFIGRLNYQNLFLIMAFVIVSIVLFSRIDFLGSKFDNQLSNADFSNNRFGSALMDWNDIQKRPLFGWSRNLEVLFNTKGYSNLTHRPNGLTNFIRSYGLIYFISYFVLIIISLKKYFFIFDKKRNLYYSFILVGVIMLMGFSQQVVHTMFTMSLLFIGFFKRK